MMKKKPIPRLVLNTLLIVGSLVTFTQVLTAATLNSTLIMFSYNDVLACPSKVALHKKGNDRIQFLPTLYYLQDDDQVQEYCSLQHGRCVSFNAAIIKNYERAFETCFSAAFKNGISVTVVPHLDDGSGAGEWRNEVAFDPLKKYEGYSYNDIMVKPLVKALTKARRGTPKTLQQSIDFSLMGEMGAALFIAPDSNLKILRHLKHKHPDWQVGFSLNHNTVTGNIEKIDVKKVQRLFDASDFVGISAYHRAHAPAQVRDFFETIIDFRTELAAYGIKMKADQNIHFSEVGMGGGLATEKGITLAKTPAEAAASPWAGFQVWPYEAAKDPWQNPALRDYRRQFYDTLIQFLALSVEKTHVTRAFNWGSGPWNFQDYEPNVYADPEIQKRVENHNSKLAPRFK